MPTEEQSEKSNDKKDMTTKLEDPTIFSLKNQIQSLVSENEEPKLQYNENNPDNKNYISIEGSDNNTDLLQPSSGQPEHKPRAID